MTRPHPIPEQAPDVVTALRVQIDALAAELERLRDEIVWMRQRAERAEQRVVLAERALSPARAMVAMHPKTHKERHWWQYAPCHHLLFVELRQALERLDETTPQKETAS